MTTNRMDIQQFDNEEEEDDRILSFSTWSQSFCPIMNFVALFHSSMQHVTILNSRNRIGVVVVWEVN